ncbi:hypothetical protein BH10ACI4_BH10ACI4_00790 [soil metagenome]
MALHSLLGGTHAVVRTGVFSTIRCHEYSRSNDEWKKNKSQQENDSIFGHDISLSAKLLFPPADNAEFIGRRS